MSTVQPGTAGVSLWEVPSRRSLWPRDDKRPLKNAFWSFGAGAERLAMSWSDSARSLAKPRFETHRSQ